jgi:hypothetical protein
MNAVDAMTRRQAIRFARECADAIIEQRTRQARGWDKGRYRDDDTWRRYTIKQDMRMYAELAFGVAMVHA